MNIDKGLDAIISSSSISSGGQRRTSNTNRRAPRRSSTQSRTSRTSNGKSGKSSKSTQATLTTALNNTNPLFFAKSVIVSNMPLDVDEKAVKEFFSQKVGRVRQVEGSYRDNGTPTGAYTLKFEKPGKALQLLEKFDNELVDGKRRLRVQILLTSDIAQAPKPLSERIGTKPASSQKPRDRRPKPAKATPKAEKAKPVKASGKANAKSSGKVGKSGKSTRAKPAKVSVAQLDAEMSDYFAKAEPASASNDINV